MRLIILLLVMWLFNACQTDIQKGRTFYVDSLTGNDQNVGTSPQNAWATLDRINKQIFLPGDSLLFHSGMSYVGYIVFKGSGSKVAPVVVDKYGQGKKPVIHGQGKNDFTLMLENVEYYIVNNLEITNTGIARKPERTGILLHACNFGDIHHIVLNNLEIHHVNGSLVKEDGGGSAIFWKNEGDSIPSRFVGLLIENCYLHDCERNGIVSYGNISRQQWYPSKNIEIRNNLLERIPGDCIVPIGCDSAIIEYNVIRNCPDILSHKEAAAGIWPWSCDNTIIQFNEVSEHRAKWDGQGFDSDYNCTGTIIRYNYSHDNYGGFLLVCNDGNSLGQNYNFGTTHSVIEYNLSVNDGVRPYPTEREGWFSPVFHITGPTRDILIANNIILSPPKNNLNVPLELIHIGNWGNAWPENIIFKENCFVQSDRTFSFMGEVQNIQMVNNNTSSYSLMHIQIPELLDSLIFYAEPERKKGFQTLKTFIEKAMPFNTLIE